MVVYFTCLSFGGYLAIKVGVTQGYPPLAHYPTFTLSTPQWSSERVGPRTLDRGWVALQISAGQGG